MRYPPEHKAESRARLVEAGAAVAKRDGFAGTGVDALAEAAGLTSGAFYRHFAGKDALLTAIVERELSETGARFSALDGEAQLLFAVDAYLSMAHVRGPEVGCILPTLTAEVARAPAATREAFERSLGEVVAVLAGKVGDRALASAIVSQCVGAVMVARAMASDEARREVLRAARAAIRAAIGRAPAAR